MKATTCLMFLSATGQVFSATLQTRQQGAALRDGLLPRGQVSDSPVSRFHDTELGRRDTIARPTSKDVELQRRAFDWNGIDFSTWAPSPSCVSTQDPIFSQRVELLVFISQLTSDRPRAWQHA